MGWFAALAFSVLSSPAFAITADEVLAQVDKSMTYDTRETYVQMTVTKGDRVKVYKMHSYGKGQDTAAIEFLEPARDKGTKMFRTADELWMYMPSVERTQKISGHMLRQGLMGSDMSYEDMMQASAWREMYTGVVEGEETVDGRACYKLKLTAKSSDVSYPVRLVWVDKASFVPLKQELYALSGTLLKTWTMGNVTTIEGRQYPMTMVVEDKLLAGSRTEIKFESMDFSVTLEEEIFSTRWLER